MGCCLGYSQAVEIIEDIAKSYYPKDYKLFVARREKADGLNRIYRVGLVVQPDDIRNSQMFDEFVALELDPNSCIKMLFSTIDRRDNMIIDLFMLEISIEVAL